MAITSNLENKELKIARMEVKDNAQLSLLQKEFPSKTKPRLMNQLK